VPLPIIMPPLVPPPPTPIPTENDKADADTAAIIIISIATASIYTVRRIVIRSFLSAMPQGTHVRLYYCTTIDGRPNGDLDNVRSNGSHSN